MSGLTLYNKKRSFKRTPEPEGVLGKRRPHKKLSFVVQKHDASRLHYDFRLEVNGVLKSWAIPKGPSMNPTDKRLAVEVEDHPLSYGGFEGTIPKGNYGAGKVEIWDKGWFEPEHIDGDNMQASIASDLESGSLKFIMHGEKLKGSFALVRLKDDKKKNWLLIKHKDEFASGSAMDPVSGNNGEKLEQQPPQRSVREPANEKLSTFTRPMLAELGDQAFDNADWVYEIKWDGYRAIAEVGDKEVKLYSRNGLSFVRLYPSVIHELKKIMKRAVLDGEIVAMDENNKPSFQKLQQYAENRSQPLQYYIFDCLSHNGNDITRLPLTDRKEFIRKVLPESSVLKYSEHVEKYGIEFFSKVKSMDLEGMVAKRADSPYQPGKRSKDWLKIKNHNTQEAIIAGYTAPKGSRNYFGALLLGIRSGKQLKYIGHTGTGFSESILKNVFSQMQPLITKTSPFKTKVPVNGAVTWVEPTLVCEVKYSEVTDDGILRHPVFMGLRIDKPAEEADHLDVMTKPTVTAKRPTPSKAAVTKAKGKELSLDNHKIIITHPDKVYWPQEKITKIDLVNYYQDVHKYILPYLKGRPESLKRNPNGIGDKGFFNKNAGVSAPDWVESISIHADSTGKEVDYIICNNRATLAYMNNLGCIEINPWNSTVENLDKPDYLIIDLDPSEKSKFDDVIDAALAVKEVLDRAKINGYCKTSGASGLHVYVPLHAAYGYDQARQFAEVIATLACEALPGTTTTERSLGNRKGKIYVDYLQNSRGQTLACPYSVRPVRGASVSTPLQWKELKHGMRPSDFTILNIRKRLEKTGDLFMGVLKEKTDLVKAIKKLER
jgi:bifunctional non-homologous end joining protein LigD